MKKVYKHKENRNLIPGEIYNFWIIKKIKLPDGNNYFVMRDPYGEKHLLPSKYYDYYNIYPQSYYLCKIDKVNCQGRLFFEPVHPIYIIGNEYFFSFEKIEILISKKQILKEYFKMKGKNGQLAYLPFDPIIKLKKGKLEKYKVVKIRKARIFLERLL